MSKIILLLGPTASGKTYISLSLAKKMNAEIINADSRYIYKEPQIATAKITKEEMNVVVHHLVDVCSLNEKYTIYNYQVDARRVLDKLIGENKNVIITGGSGLYIKALLYNYELEKQSIDDTDYTKYTNLELKEKIDLIDKNNNIHVNNRQRMIRYLSYYNSTGKTIKKDINSSKRVYDFISIGLNASRENLYERINLRVDEMFKSGLLEEAERLYNLNYINFDTIIGYKELISYFKNEISLDRAKELIKQNTRHYAKRQLTWFNNQMDNVKWFDVKYEKVDETVNEILEFINGEEI